MRGLLAEFRLVLVPSLNAWKASLQIEMRDALAAMLAFGTAKLGMRNATTLGCVAALFGFVAGARNQLDLLWHRTSSRTRSDAVASCYRISLSENRCALFGLML